MLVMSYHHNTVQLANCSILQDQRQKSFCLHSISSSMEQLVDVTRLSADECMHNISFMPHHNDTNNTSMTNVNIL